MFFTCRMKNPYKNIDIKGNKVPVQRKQRGGIAKIAAERPEKTKIRQHYQRRVKVSTASR